MTEGGRTGGHWLPGRIVGLAILTAVPTSLPAQASPLARALEARLDAAPFNRQFWGVAVLDEPGLVEMLIVS